MAAFLGSFCAARLRLRRSLAMVARVSPLAVATIQMVDDRVRALVDDGSILEHERRNLVAARLAAQLLAVARLGRNLPRDEGHAQLGESLAHSLRMRAPFSLVELVHKPWL